MDEDKTLGVPASPSRDPLQPSVSATPANAEEFHALILNHEDALTEGSYEGMNHHWTRIALVNAFEAARTDAYAEGRKDEAEERAADARDAARWRAFESRLHAGSTPARSGWKVVETCQMYGDEKEIHYIAVAVDKIIKEQA